MQINEKQYKDGNALCWLHWGSATPVKGMVWQTSALADSTIRTWPHRRALGQHPIPLRIHMPAQRGRYVIFVRWISVKLTDPVTLCSSFCLAPLVSRQQSYETVFTDEEEKLSDYDVGG